MKKIISIAVLLSIHYISQAQKTVTVQAGISRSKLDWNIIPPGIKIFNKTITGQSVFVGVDYFNLKIFNLSTNLGYVRKGGASDIMYSDLSGNYLYTKTESATLDYISFNTAVNLKLPGMFSPFISAGPRVDILVSSNHFFDSFKDNDELEKISYGLILGGGFKLQLARLIAGVRVDYLLNADDKVAEHKSNGTATATVADKTYLVNAFVGFRLK
ncbi:MAG TPA: outer membrane beta-barrel protein [Ferruginibacter sp.]|nr:outer membrane beta-barrel protein [Ferruginibacter sp.]